MYWTAQICSIQNDLLSFNVQYIYFKFSVNSFIIWNIDTHEIGVRQSKEPTEMEIIILRLVQNKVINKIIKLSKHLAYKAFEPNNTVCLIFSLFIVCVKRIVKRIVYNFPSWWKRENSHRQLNGDVFLISSNNIIRLSYYLCILLHLILLSIHTFLLFYSIFKVS